MNNFLPNPQPINNLVEKRKTIDLLPQGPAFISESDNLKKFFDATVDQWFQPESVKSFGGFIGRREGLYYRSLEQAYLEEVSNQRENYQLEPSSTSIDNNENINFIFTYPDLINKLKSEGALTNNHSRLFAQEYLSWAPPVNIDMLTNFSNYYWLVTGPTTSTITSTTNAKLDIIGQTEFEIDGISFESGSRIIFTNDENFEFNNRPFIVEGVGTSIELIDDSEFDGFGLYDSIPYDTGPYDAADVDVVPDYITIARNSMDRNPWSRNNRWFHKDLIGNIDLTDFSVFQARRPIIEFLPNIKLINYGRCARPDVDFIIDDMSILDLSCKSSFDIAESSLFDGARVLITGDPDPERNNRVYVVHGINTAGKIGFDIETQGIDKNGVPVEGEKIRLVGGNQKDIEYHFDGNDWVLSQEKNSFNQYPLFELYDYQNIILNDQGIYPGSDFGGSRIFEYVETPGADLDRFLNLPIEFATFGDIKFNNLLSSQDFTYDFNFDRPVIEGYYNYRLMVDKNPDNDQFENDWHQSEFVSRQRIIDRWVIRQKVTDDGLIEFQRFYELSIDPDDNTINQDNYQVILNGFPLVEDFDYDLTDKTLELSLSLELNDGDVLEVKSWADQMNLGENQRGYFEIPTNLEANPNNREVEIIEFNEFNQHFVSIIENQPGFVGKPQGPNNYRNTLRDLSKGTKILNHTAPLLKTMLLTGDNDLDFTQAIRYAEREYSRFKRKLINTFNNLRTSGGFTSSIPYSEWVSAALDKINAGKNQSFPFFNSQILDIESFIPSSPASLGITQIYKPEIFLDDTRLNPVNVIRGHDGSIIDAFNNEVDQALLEFETQVYEQVLELLRSPDYRPPMNNLERIPGYFRQTDYNRDEWLSLSRPSFERWAISNRVNYVDNISYQQSDTFTWNYSTVQGPDGNLLPGFWRGIYSYFYDTDRPHSHPWEMLGFTIKPEWWEDEYGPEPWTRNNLVLWKDLEQGIIRQGSLAGTYEHLQRPGLLNLIPVDDQGNLLDPFQAGIAQNYPGTNQARDKWKFGDGSPGEYTWRTNFGYSFNFSEILFLAHPNEFIEFNWDPTNLIRVNDKVVFDQTFKRLPSSQFQIHNEILEGERVEVIGLSQWISDRLTYLGKDIRLNFGNIVRDLGVNLTYRAGGYTKENTLRLLNDSFGLIPQENVNIELSKSSPVKQFVYSGVIIQRSGRGFIIYGYDNLNQYFKTLPSITTGKKSVFDFNNTRVIKYSNHQNKSISVPYGTKMLTIQEVFTFLSDYQAYLESEGWVFDSYDESSQRFIDFEFLAEQFVIWARNNEIQDGQTLIVSPLSSLAKIDIDQGQIDNIQTFIQGSYGVLDRDGFGITTEDFDVSRLDNTFSVEIIDETNTGIHLLKLNAVEYEHTIVVDNVTKFDDLIYNPLLGLRQPRLRIFIQKTQQWTGRGQAFGFIIQQNGLIDNFEKVTNDIADYYSFENLNQGTLTRDVAKHTIGFQERDYLSNLLLDRQIEFEFYRGFLRQKGTSQAIDKILRSDFVTETADFNISEEWAFRIGEYGNLERKSALQFDLRVNDFKTNPQIIQFTNNTFDDPEDTLIELIPDDDRWVLKRPENLTTNQFQFRNFKNSFRRDYPNAGYIRTDEFDYSFIQSQELDDIFFEQNENFVDGNIFWQPIRNDQSWDVFRLNNQGLVSEIIPGAQDGDPGIIQLETAHEIEVGDAIFIMDSTESSPDYEGFSIVVGVPSANQIELETPTETGKTFAVGEGPQIFVLKTIRFDNISDRDTYTPLNGWNIGDRVFVDQATDSRWEVFEWNGTSWISVRQENDKIDIEQIFNSLIYDQITSRNVIRTELIDPYKGLIPSNALKNISFQLDYDPAKYTDGDEERFQIDPDQAWGMPQVGKIWFDLSTVRWIDYEQGEFEYRLNNWAKIAPGTSVDVYEWTRSPVPPGSWDNYVNSFDRNDRDFIPSGTLKFGSEQPFVIRREFDLAQDRMKPFYYFWVLKPDFIPPSSQENRQLSARSIAELIENPTAQMVPWIAPISQDAFIISNVEEFINDETSVLLINFLEQPDRTTIHKQWILHSEQNSTTPPNERLWNKMKDSLLGYDRLGLVVPDPNLFEIEKYGNRIRPRQSWFIDRRQARIEFILKANKLLAVKNVVNEISNWDVGLRGSDPIPDSNLFDHSVFSLVERNNLVGVDTGDIVLVESDQTQDGRWTVYEFQLDGSWLLIQKQIYRTEDFWMLIDWYAEGFSEQTIIKQTFDTISDRNSSLNNFKQGDVVRVLDNGQGLWVLYERNIQGSASTWRPVAQEDGTISFRLSVADYDITDQDLDQEASLVTQDIINALQDNLLTILEQNLIFFNMVHTVHTQQPVVDWAFKTSFIFGIGNVDVLEQDFIFIRNQSDRLLEYINEAKPYHVKVRGLLERKQVPDEIIEIDIDDSYEILAKIDFNRVSYDSQIPEGANPKNYDISKLSAADRIQLFYQPTEGMPAKIFEKLISRCEYGGTVMDGKSFYQFGTILGAGYDFQDYDNRLGYDFNENEIQEFYDVFVNAGSLDGTTVPVSEGDSGIIVDGWKFHQPFIEENRPEELVKTRSGDAVDIQVFIEPPEGEIEAGYDVQAYDTFPYDFDASDVGIPFTGGPRIRIKRYNGEIGGSTGPYPVGQFPLSRESLFVFVNDILQIQGTDYAVDWSSQNPLINLSSAIDQNDDLKIQSFGSQKHPDKKILEKNTNETVFDVCEEITGVDRIFASVDGEIADFTVSGTEVTITNPLPSNSTVLILFYAEGDYSITRTQEEIATMNGSETFTVQTPGESTTPSYRTTIVHKNGLRLSPPLMKVYEAETLQNTFKIGAQVTNSADVRVFQEQNELIQGFDQDFVVNYVTSILVDDGGQDYVVGETITFGGPGTGAAAEISKVDSNGSILEVLVTDPGNGYDSDPTLSINTTAGSGAVIQVHVARGDVLIVGSGIAPEDEILVIYEDGNDYTIDPINTDQLTVDNVSIGDRIRITTFTEDSRLGMQTEVFNGNALGFYNLGLCPYDANHTWVSVNGSNMIHLQDFVLKDQDQGFDSEYQGYGLIYDATLDYGVSFKELTQTPNDRVVITYFTNRPEKNPAAFRLYKNIFGDYDSLRISDDHSTILTQPLLSSDNEIVVEDATVLGQPNIDAHLPGIIFIRGERIIFWEVDITVPRQHVLKRVLRGTGGTGINVDLPAEETVRDASKNQEIPGGYVWKSAPEGFLELNDNVVKFLTEKPGRKNFNC